MQPDPPVTHPQERYLQRMFSGDVLLHQVLFSFESSLIFFDFTSL